jgi:hypothetical protein
MKSASDAMLLFISFMTAISIYMSYEMTLVVSRNNYVLDKQRIHNYHAKEFLMHEDVLRSHCSR